MFCSRWDGRLLNGGTLMSFANTPARGRIAAEIQRQAIVHLPIVLHPARELLRIEMDVEVAYADAVGPRNREIAARFQVSALNDPETAPEIGGSVRRASIVPMHCRQLS
jgi:hypothetical protein